MDGQNLRVIVTLDFEEWEGKSNIFEADLYTKTKRIVDLLLEKNMPATFFLDAETTLKFPRATDLLRNERFELALHSDYHFGPKDWYSPDLDFSRQNSETQIARMIRGTKMIREVIPDFSPKGFRAPGLRWNEDLYTSLSKLEFLYDSSQQSRYVFQPFLVNGVLVFPMNSGDYDSACYKMGVRYVINTWRDNFRRACEAETDGVSPYFLLLLHPSVSGKYKYIGLVKSMFNFLSYFDVQYMTCLDAARDYLGRTNSDVGKLKKNHEL